MCITPITIKVKNNKFGPSVRQVPCGHCVDCLKQYQNDWYCRIYEECIQHSKVIFFTLTYNQDSVPYVLDPETGEIWLSVVVKHLQNAWKRFRVRRDLPEHKYFLCSEYGPKTQRPHYHGLVFGLTLDEFRPFLKDWENRYGFTNAKVVKFDKDDYHKVSRYVSKYCSKGVFENPNVKAGIVCKSFRLNSQHFGESYVGRMRAFHRGVLYKGRKRGDGSYYGYDKDFIAFLAHNRNVEINGIKYHMPQYYRSKIYGNKVTDFSNGKSKLHSQTCLSVAISNFVFEESCRLRDEQLQFIQSQRGCTLSEAYYLMALQDDFETSHREVLSGASLTRFYSHSKL